MCKRYVGDSNSKAFTLVANTMSYGLFVVAQTNDSTKQTGSFKASKIFY